ncbi:MAG: hypothetical protein AAF329_06255 [Cyanobacteria bacterium P01_A01_bin.17]
MQLILQPLLRIQRDLYRIPNPMQRFREYLQTLTNGTDEMVLPLSLMNPMGKRHVETRLGQLLELQAEKIAEQSLRDAERRLPFLDAIFRVALVLADDAGGEWTHRALTDATHRFEDPGRANDGWIVVLLWTSEIPTTESIQSAVLSIVYRRLYQNRHGFPKTLHQMMRQEGYATRFAGGGSPSLEADDLAYTRAALQPHLGTTHFPTQLACLYGDQVATSMGYPALGLSADAGYIAANAAAQESSLPPETMLFPES